MQSQQFTITICSSAAFFKDCIAIAQVLRKKNYCILLPETAEIMLEKNDFDVKHYKTWHNDHKDFPKKAQLIQNHFEKIARGNAILVVNNKKHSIEGYIGGNTLMEMGLAFYLKKPIFILNQVSSSASSFEEIMGMLPVFLDGNLDTLVARLKLSYYD